MPALSSCGAVRKPLSSNVKNLSMAQSQLTTLEAVYQTTALDRWGKALLSQGIIKPSWLCFCWYVGLFWEKEGYNVVACAVLWWVLLISLLLALAFEVQLTWAITWCLLWNTVRVATICKPDLSCQGRAFLSNISLPPFSRSTLD